MRTLLSAFAIASLISASAFAAPCRDARGKFIKCPPAKAAPVRKAPCKDAKGKFIKCPK